MAPSKAPLQLAGSTPFRQLSALNEARNVDLAKRGLVAYQLKFSTIHGQQPPPLLNSSCHNIPKPTHLIHRARVASRNLCALSFIFSLSWDQTPVISASLGSSPSNKRKNSNGFPSTTLLLFPATPSLTHIRWFFHDAEVNGQNKPHRTSGCPA